MLYMLEVADGMWKEVLGCAERLWRSCMADLYALFAAAELVTQMWKMRVTHLPPKYPLHDQVRARPEARFNGVAITWRCRYSLGHP